MVGITELERDEAERKLKEFSKVKIPYMPEDDEKENILDYIAKRFDFDEMGRDEDKRD